MELRNAVCIVTGASRGIGKALTECLGEHGAILASCARSGDYPVDVRDSRQVDMFVQKILDRHGRIDVVINNAGAVHPLVSLEKITDQEYDVCMDTNVRGVFNMCRAVLPYFRQRKQGAIINIGSRAGFRPHPQLAVYSASKFAVRGLTQAVARDLEEFGSAVRCFSVSPGGVDTPMRAHLFGVQDSAEQQSASSVAEHIARIILDDAAVSSGSDVHIVRGEISAIYPPPAH